jgi:hypothetical protein
MSPIDPQENRIPPAPGRRKLAESDHCPHCGMKMVDGHPAGQNPISIARGRSILETYMNQTGATVESSAACGLLFDLLHHANASGRDLDEEMCEAHSRYDEECEGEKL